MNCWNSQNTNGNRTIDICTCLKVFESNPSERKNTLSRTLPSRPSIHHVDMFITLFVICNTSPRSTNTDKMHSIDSEYKQWTKECGRLRKLHFSPSPNEILPWIPHNRLFQERSSANNNNNCRKTAATTAILMIIIELWATIHKRRADTVEKIHLLPKRKQ